jgi:hypothetical protein
MKNVTHTFNLSVEHVLSKISLDATASALKAYQDVTDEQQDNISTTIRLKYPVKKFYETLADEMGISLQAMITVALTTLIKNQLLMITEEKPRDDCMQKDRN